MQARLGAMGFALIVALGLMGCSRSAEPHLMNFYSNTRGPDEFAVLPTKPLQMPKDLKDLPTPTPGGTDLVDPTPDADAVAALGGRPSALQAGAIPAGDKALIAQVTRYGTDPKIRAQLAAADREYRRKHPGKVLPRLLGLSQYNYVYKPMELDQYAALKKWRAAGLPTDTAPPKAGQ